MNYYEVWISSPKYHSTSPLTYTSADELNPGDVVIVPMQKFTVPAVVIGPVGRPAFKTKSIIRCVPGAHIPQQLLTLIDWLKDYYPAPFGQTLALVLPSSLSTEGRPSKAEQTNEAQDAQTLPGLTKEQSATMKNIRSNKATKFLLHGDTGTGKTRIYVELAKESLAQGKSAIVLTPEIGLTPQLAETFEHTFPDQTYILHSEQTPAQRRNNWLEIARTTQPSIVIGPRSALFAPLKDIGLVVVDEFHDSAYKQEQAPYYQATRVAGKLADLHKARLILGSATPPVHDYYTFAEKKLPILRLREKAVKSIHKTESQVIDLKKRELFTTSPWLADRLLEEIATSLVGGMQSLVFLNRRGTARLILCKNCGWELVCPNCDLPLTYHADHHNSQCHTCGYKAAVPSSCPNCSAIDIIFKSIGTKSLVSELERIFPQAAIMRFDSDTAKNDSLSKRYTDIKNGAADIIVGTQMLGKGLDLPKLRVLGVVLADTSLSFPDYTAEERTFQLISQVIGRVHRGHTESKAFVQTFNPDSPIINASLLQDYESFYAHQIEERKIFRYPPFRFVLKLTCERSSSPSAQRAAMQLTTSLHRLGLPIEIIGPTPAFTEKIHNKYRWQVIIKAVDRQRLLDIISTLPANWSYDIDPSSLL